MFTKSIDVSSHVKSGKTIFETLDIFFGEIGERNVVQQITDNGRNMFLVGQVFYFLSLLYAKHIMYHYNSLNVFKYILL